ARFSTVPRDRPNCVRSSRTTRRGSSETLINSGPVFVSMSFLSLGEVCGRVKRGTFQFLLYVPPHRRETGAARGDSSCRQTVPRSAPALVAVYPALSP